MSAKNILVIDDDLIFHFMIKKIIRRIDKDFTVFSFYDANKALDFLNEVSASNKLFPDFIFLDINMPGMTGWEFLDIYKNEKYGIRKNVDLYMISSSNDQKDINKAKQLNTSGYLIKPLQFAQLKNIITN